MEEEKSRLASFITSCAASSAAAVRDFSQLKVLFIEASTLSLDDAIATNSVELVLWVVESKILNAFSDSALIDDIDAAVFFSSADVQ